jgi:hypothetical protein
MYTIGATPTAESTATYEPTATTSPTGEPSPTQALGKTCTNRKYGFGVSYPSAWYTNDAASLNGDLVAACTLFAPFADIEVLPEPINVPIMLKLEGGALPDDGSEVTIDGRPGVLVETEVNGEKWYIYYAAVSEQERFAGFAFDNGSVRFAASRKVLDAMIATLDLDHG